MTFSIGQKTSLQTVFSKYAQYCLYLDIHVQLNPIPLSMLCQLPDSVRELQLSLNSGFKPSLASLFVE